jgi:hypothetical protein
MKLFKKLFENLYEFIFRTKENQLRIDREISKRIELEIHLYEMNKK